VNTIQRILKNTFSLLAGDIVAQFLVFVSVIYLARVLGPQYFGKINFTLAIVIYFTLIANFGLPLLGTREIARQRDQVREYIGSIVALRLVLALLGLIGLFLLTFLLGKSPEFNYLLILYGFGFIPSALLLDWVFQGIEKMEYIGLSRILSSVIYLMLVVWLVRGPGQLLLIPCFQVIGNLLAALFLIVVSTVHFGKFSLSCNLSRWKYLLRQAFPIGASIILIQIVHYLDTVMLGFMKSDAEVGYYSAGYKIIMLLLTMGAAYYNAIFPVFSHYYHTSLDSLKRLQKYTMRLMISISLPLAVGGTILAKPLLFVFYGIHYGPAVPIFQVLVWTVAIGYLSMGYSKGLIACGKQHQRMKIDVVHACVAVALNFIFIPLYGALGAAIATVAGHFVAIFLGFRQLSKIVSVPFVRPIFKAFCASCGMALFLMWGLRSEGCTLFLLIFLGAVVYIALLSVIKGITYQDIQMIRSAILKRNEG